MEAGSLSVITIAQRTENDMSAWSDDMDTERELLTEHYVAAAKEICARQGNSAGFLCSCRIK